MKIVMVACTVMLLALAAAGTAGEVNPTVVSGERLFVSEGCYGCHTIGVVGTPIGPDLAHIGLRYSAARLARWLENPQAERPGAHMPKLDLSPADIDALAAYLATLRG